MFRLLHLTQGISKFLTSCRGLRSRHGQRLDILTICGKLVRITHMYRYPIVLLTLQKIILSTSLRLAFDPAKQIHHLRLAFALSKAGLSFATFNIDAIRVLDSKIPLG
jgi:hypothetical protein